MALRLYPLGQRLTFPPVFPRFTRSASVISGERNGSLRRRKSSQTKDEAGQQQQPQAGGDDQKPAAGAKLIEVEKSETGKVSGSCQSDPAVWCRLQTLGYQLRGIRRGCDTAFRH